MKDTLTVLILAKNSADTLPRTLKSVKGLEAEITVVDGYSKDDTVSTALSHGATVYQRVFDGFAASRRQALSLVKTEWTLVLDSDETLSPASRQEIRQAVQEGSKDGYLLCFRNHLFGKKLMHGELHRKLVLFRTGKAKIAQKEVHEQYEIEGTVGELEGEVNHYSYRSPWQVTKKFLRYAFLAAKERKIRGRRVGLRELMLNPPHMFYARYFGDGGYKDGILSRAFLDLSFAGMEFLSYALVPFIKGKKRIAVDIGSHEIGQKVGSGIDRLLQGIYANKSEEFDYFWYGFGKKAKNRLPMRLFAKLWLPLAARFSRADVFMGISGIIPELLRFSKMKKILFLYDFGFIWNPYLYGEDAIRLRHQTERSIRDADLVVFLHRELCEEFINLYPHDANKAIVIPSGADHLEAVEGVRPEHLTRAPEYLAVGVVKPAKRIDRLLRVVGSSNTLLAGHAEPEYARSLSLSKHGNVHILRKFSDAELKWLYTHSKVLINTSASEGFCYPVLEALIAGLPAVTFPLRLFREYKQFFPHLTIVHDEEEMKKFLSQDNFTMQKPHTDHPYKWAKFGKSLMEVAGNKSFPRKARHKTACIVILYNTPQEEKKRLEKEIAAMAIPDYRIYWIDNTDSQKGYAAGINEGIREGLADGCDIFMAMNPDISLAGLKGESIEENADRFGLWGYAMEQDGKVYYGGTLDKWRLSGGLYESAPKTRHIVADFISASVICFTEETVRRVGMWDETYVMYYEDVDYCMRARKKGIAVVIDTAGKYVHFEVSKLNKKKERWIGRSRWLFFWKYANIAQKAREIARLPKTFYNMRKKI